MDTIQSIPQKEKEKKQYALYVFIFIIVFCIGVFAGYEIPVFQKRTYEDGWNAARVRLASSSQFGFLENARIGVKTIDGTVSAVENGRVSLSIVPLTPLASPELDTRIISFSDITRVTRVVPRTDEEYKKEFDTYMTKLRSGKTDFDITPPVSFSIAESKVSDIKVGDKIIVTAQEDIENMKSFVALEVQIQ